MNKLKVTKTNWFLSIASSIGLYIALTYKGISFTQIEWIGILLYNLSLFILIMPLAEIIYPDTDKNYYLNRRGFVVIYILLTVIPYVLLQ